MPGHFSVEELVIDDSFINYCLQKNEADELFWKQYITEHPFEKAKIEEAKNIVFGLTVMLEQKYSLKNFRDEKNIHILSKTLSFKRRFRYAAAAAAVFLAIFIIRNIVTTKHPSNGSSIVQILPENSLIYKTVNGERKIITLPDKTKIWLNAGSELRVDSNFGRMNRKVYLSGEALFDVIHNKSLPFIVHINNCEIKDLGTLFNVKAYPDDRQSETSLIRGEVEIQLNESGRKIYLSPNQKAVIKNNCQVQQKRNFPVNKVASVVPLSYNQKDSAVIETAWTKNRLEIANEDFDHMQEKLERWFNVTINIQDEEVGKYPFTGTFENEDIEHVLQALQYAYHFNYTIKNNEITISKLK
ncbi:MAG: FecR family protein [Ginsengibacter sp.]